jgi:hypothetical protein
MEKTGQIEIRVTGTKGNIELSPDNYDIKEIATIFEQVENLLFPNNKKERPTISYDIQAGSVRHIIKTSLQAVIGFNALLLQIQQNGYSVDFLEPPTARAFQYFENNAKKNDISFEISTSLENSSRLFVDKTTEFFRTEEVWVDAELYFYGTIVDAGGKSSANIHLDTKNYGLLKIDSDKEQLRGYEENPLYKTYGIRTAGKQNLVTGEIDKSNLKLIEIIGYDPVYKDDYIKGLIKKASKTWKGVPDADEWLSQIR